MACYHPLKAFPIGLTDNNKTKYKICSYDVDYVYRINDNWYAGQRHDGDSHFRPLGLCDRYVDDFVEIPCGQCLGCRIQYSRQWANRCMLELQYHKSSYFVTLTYDDLHIPIARDPETGETNGIGTLCKRDFQLFMKRLRKQTCQELRYFAAGEYGSETRRPHYHAIIFGLELDDLQVYKRSPQGFTYYNSKTVQDVWPNGYAVVADVSWETCAYTARYIVKKLRGPEAAFYVKYHLEPEFSLMSRKPGLARKYFDEHPGIYDFDFINISTEKKGLKFRPPRYFDQLYDLDHPDDMARIKVDRREYMEDLKRFKLEHTSKNYLEMLADEELAFINRTKSLERKCI